MLKTSRELLKLCHEYQSWLPSRESKGWLPEGENTLCFKSNNAEAADAAAAAAAAAAASAAAPGCCPGVTGLGLLMLKSPQHTSVGATFCLRRFPDSVATGCAPRLRLMDMELVLRRRQPSAASGSPDTGPHPPCRRDTLFPPTRGMYLLLFRCGRRRDPRLCRQRLSRLPSVGTV